MPGHYASSHKPKRKGSEDLRPRSRSSIEDYFRVAGRPELIADTPSTPAILQTGCAQRALDVSRSLQGDKPYSSLTGQSLLLQARIDKSRGEGAKAKDLAAQAVTQLVETVGEEHPDSRTARELATAATLSR